MVIFSFGAKLVNVCMVAIIRMTPETEKSLKSGYCSNPVKKLQGMNRGSQ